MNAERAKNIIALVALLQTEPSVQWDEVETLLAGFPNWLGLIRLLRMQQPRLPYLAAPLPELQVGPEARERLRALFEPYAILLNPARSSVETMRELERQGVDIRRFCRYCFDNDDEWIVEAALAVLEAYDAQATLMRGAVSPAHAPDQLLRTADGAAFQADALLTPATSPGPPETAPRKIGWLPRLLARLKGKR